MLNIGADNRSTPSSHQLRMARMIYMLSQCKDAKDNPAVLFVQMRRRELSVFIARIARVEKSELWRIFAPH